MNLKSLARNLGISKTTVSRALNGYPEVNVLTRERVLAAAKEAGYEPNPMARSLAVGRTNEFGIIYPLLPSDLIPWLGSARRLIAQRCDALLTPP